jgi:hypothetical protein
MFGSRKLQALLAFWQAYPLPEIQASLRLAGEFAAISAS